MYASDINEQSLENTENAHQSSYYVVSAKLSTSMKLYTILGHHMGTNFIYGAIKKNQYFYRGGHICSAITAILIFCHISTTN